LKAIPLRTIIQLGQADDQENGRASLGGTRRKTGKEESEEAAAQNERGLGKGEGKGKARSWRTSGGSGAASGATACSAASFRFKDDYLHNTFSAR